MEPQWPDVGLSSFSQRSADFAPRAARRVCPSVPSCTLAWVDDRTSIAVDLEERLPRVCFKCAATHEIVRRPEVLTVTSQSARNMGMVGGAIGAGAASIMRNSKELLVPLLGVLAVGLVIFSVYTNKTARRVEVAIPLCVACDQRWSKAKGARPFFLVAFIASALAVLLGMASENKALLIGGGVLFFAVCIYAVVTKPAAAFVGATWAEGSRVVLAMVNERTVAMIRNGEVPKRKKKKASRESAPNE
jgi:hypothetical protein